jgi:hypothetical protein
LKPVNIECVVAWITLGLLIIKVINWLNSLEPAQPPNPAEAGLES